MKIGFGKAMTDQKGSILVEFTLTMVILLVLFLAAITFTFLFSDYYGVHKVAREGAKEASITKDITWAEKKALQSARLWGLDTKKIQINFSRGSNSVTCHVTYTATPINKTFPTLVGKEQLREISLSSKATFVWIDGKG